MRGDYPGGAAGTVYQFGHAFACIERYQGANLRFRVNRITPDKGGGRLLEIR